MDAIEHLNETVWKRPGDYGGYSPDGDYCILAKTRDSDALARSNWRCILNTLNAAAYDGGADYHDDRPIAYHWRAGHWGVGWIEYLMIRADAPDAIKQTAGEIICALESYPVYDEQDFSELEYSEACEYWERCSVKDRLDYIQRADNGISIFAARRAELPSDDNGSLMELLTSP